MLGRRDFLKSFGAGIALVSSGAAFGKIASASEPCVLDIMRKKERYLIDLRNAEGMRCVAHLLRDIEAGGIVGIPDINMLRLAAWAQAWMAAYGTMTVLDVSSGLRTRTHNYKEGGAPNSRHIPGPGNRFSAMDVNPRGIDREYFGQLVARAGFGGVGWYKTHIHFDYRPKPTYWRVGV